MRSFRLLFSHTYHFINCLRFILLFYFLSSFILFLLVCLLSRIVFIHASYHRDEYDWKLGLNRIREERERDLLKCPVEDCDGSGHISGNFATHRRQAGYSFTFSASTSLQTFKKFP